MLPAIILILFYIYCVMAAIMLILSLTLPKDSIGRFRYSMIAVLVTLATGIPALWQTLEVWNMATQAPRQGLGF